MGVEKSVQELATMVQEVNGGSVEMRHGPTGQGDMRKSYSMMNKVRTALGWEPRVALCEELELTWDWCRRWEGKG
jgi:nucleoside-diphosphate-sugar epimerase